MASAWNQLDQLLTCAICLDRYKNPKLLPCQHTFCMEPCLEGLIDYARRQIKCPECRGEHRIPYQGIQSFPTNVTLMRFLELHRDITGEEPEPPPCMMERCNVCGEKNFLNKCSHCDKKLCDECREAHVDILRREINRINNQVRRGVHRLGETLSQTQKNGEKLEQNCARVRQEIEDLVQRYIKNLKDAEERLKHELNTYMETELQSINKLKENLELEVSNITSNCELAEKHITEDMEWTDAELVEYKDIFLKSLDFLRNFDADSSDYGRRVKFQSRSDPDVLHRTLAELGELKINAPSPLNTSPSFSSSSLPPPSSNALMRSQSDHRLAAQFQRRQESSKSYLDINQRYGGHASDSERDGSLTSPSSSYLSRSRREFGDSSGNRREYVDREGSRSRLYREDGLLTSRGWRDSDGDISSGLRSRLGREGIDEDDTHYGRTVRFEEPNQPAQQPQRERIFDTEDATKGPLSGVIRLIDSPHVMERLHQNEARRKQQQLEKERKAQQPVVPTPQAPPPPPRRTPSRQVSEDEIEKQKKQNQLAANTSTAAPSSPTSAVPTAPGTPPPVLSGTPLSPTSLTSPSDSFQRPLSRRVAALQKEEDSPARNRSSPESGPRTGRRPSLSQDTGSDGDTSRRGSQEDDSSPDNSSVGRARRRRGSNESEPPRPPSRSGRSLLGKSQSLDQAGDDDAAARSANRLGRAASLDKKEEEQQPRRPLQSSFYGRLSTQRRPGEPEVHEERREEESESETDSDDVSSSESDSTDAENGSHKKLDTSSSVSALLSRSAQARKDSEVKRQPTASTGGVYSSRLSQYAREKEREEESRPSSYRPRREGTRPDEPPTYARYGSQYRRRPSGAEEDTEDTNSAYGRYLARSRSSALLGSKSNSRDESPEEAGRYRKDLKLEGLNKNRIGRSKSSLDVNQQGEESGDEDATSGSSHRTRVDRTTDNALARSRSHHALKSREQSPEETPTAASSWAQYLRNKYGSKNVGGSGSAKSVPRSRSSHTLYSRSGSDSSDEEGNRSANYDSPTSSSYNFSYPRSVYMQKRRMLMKIGCRGTEPGCFTWPRGVAVAPDNSIVVADSSNHRVQVFDSSGKFLQEFGSYGSNDGEFDCLAGVAVNRIGQFIVSDRYNHRIQVFDPSGRFLRAFGCEGRTDGRFSYPWGITTDSLGFIYICDKENHRIQVFQSDGTFVGKFGMIGSRPGHLEHPHYIAVSNTNRVIVSDSNNHRIQIFDVNGRSLSTFGTEGSEDGQFKFPRGVAVDDQGYIVVGDSGNNRIQIFHPDGTFLRAFGSWGAGEGEFKGLEGIAVMSNGNILVCDRENHRIQIF